MTTSLKIIVSIVLFGIIGNVLAQPATGDNQDGRYRLIVVNEGSYGTPYVIDSQTGHVWRRAVDSANNMFVFESINYRNIDGELSKVPNEIATGIVLKNNVGQTNPFPNSNSTRNNQSAEFWQQQLTNIKAGKQWKATENGPLQPPSDSAAETVQRYLNQAQAQKDKQQ